MTEHSAIEVVFAEVPLFARIGRRQLGGLVKKSTVRSFNPGDVIVRQGDSSMTLYVILDGAVRLERRADADEAGDAVPIGTLGRAGFFGEMGLLDDLPRSATVVATEQTQCALLSRWDFRGEFGDDPAVALALTPVLAARIRELEEQLTLRPPD